MIRNRLARATLAPILSMTAACATLPEDVYHSPPAVEFEFRGNQIVVPVLLEAKGPYSMLLDTGADPSLVDARLVDELGLDPTTLPDLVVGELHAGDVAAVTADLSEMEDALGIRIDGVLGQSFLEGRVVRIDYPDRIVEFPASGSHPEERERVVIPFRRAEEALLVDDAAIGDQAVTAIVDTGFDGTIAITGSAHSPEEATVRRFRIGGLTVSSPDVTFQASEEKRSYGVRVGNGFLKDYVVTIDYPREEIVVEGG